MVGRGKEALPCVGPNMGAWNREAEDTGSVDMGACEPTDTEASHFSLCGNRTIVSA